MAKKLEKKIEGNDVIITVLGIDEPMTFNTNDLPKEIQDRLIPFGAGHKLGDAAASAKTPEDAKKNIERVWQGMMEAKWTVRAPAEEGEKTPRLSKSVILANIANLPPEQQEQAKVLLAAMGIKLD
jgi:predicted RNase H-like HicB family nuclease